MVSKVLEIARMQGSAVFGKVWVAFWSDFYFTVIVMFSERLGNVLSRPRASVNLVRVR